MSLLHLTPQGVSLEYGGSLHPLYLRRSVAGEDVSGGRAPELQGSQLHAPADPPGEAPWRGLPAQSKKSFC